MSFSVRHIPSKSKYTLKVYFGGNYDTAGNVYKSVEGGLVLVDNVRQEECIDAIEYVALMKGYEKDNYQVYTRSERKYNPVNLTNTLISNMIKNVKVNRELNFFLDGSMEKVEPEYYPIIFFWNCQWMNLETYDMLATYIAIYNPSIVFLIETRSTMSKIGKISQLLGFANFWACPVKSRDEENIEDSGVDSGIDSGNCVGLGVLWKSSLKLEVSEHTNSYIIFDVCTEDGKSWELITFYGHPSNKDLTIKWFVELSARTKFPKLWIGDFNHIKDTNETTKVGNNAKDKSDMSKFKKCLEGCCDLEHVGENKLTWKGGNGLKKKLDRAVFTKTLIEYFPKAELHNLSDQYFYYGVNQYFSDHAPQVVYTNTPKVVPYGTLVKRMNDLIDFVSSVGRGYEQLPVLPTTGYFKKVVTKRDHFFKIAETIIPHIFKASFIIVIEGSKKVILTVERLVEVRGHLFLKELLLHGLGEHQQPRRYINATFQNFPIHEKDKGKDCNFSIQQQTCDVLSFFSTENKERSDIVDLILKCQVGNLVKWHKEYRKKRSIEELDLMRFRFAILSIILSLLKERKIGIQGQKGVLFTQVADIADRYKLYSAGKMYQLAFLATLRKILDANSNDTGDYQVSEHQMKKALKDLEGEMFEVSHDAFMVEKLKNWIPLLERDKEEKELIKLADDKIIDLQITLLQGVGCISTNSAGQLKIVQDSDVKKMQILLMRAADEVLKNNKPSQKKVQKKWTRDKYISDLKTIYLALLKESEEPESETPTKRTRTHV